MDAEALKFPNRNEFMYAQEDTPLTIGPRFRFLRPGYELREQWSYTDIVRYSSWTPLTLVKHFSP